MVVFPTAKWRRGVQMFRATRSSGPEPFPNAAEIGRNIKFLTVNAGFELS
jgi:hypothetical protein